MGLNRAILFLCFVGAFIAGALSYSSLTGKSIPCGAAAGCDAVSMHASSKWFGLPVAYFGLAGYLLLAGLALARAYGPADRWPLLTKVSLAGSTFGFAASLYFTYTSIAVIQQTCSWCLASAATMTVVFLLTLFMSQMGAPGGWSRQADGLVAMAGFLVAVGGIGGYGAYVQGAADAVMGDVKLSAVSEAEIVPTTAKVRGAMDAPVTVIEFADFNCSACRTSKPKIREVLAATGGKARHAFRHVPLVQIPGHETSMQAAVIAEYAASQGRFWEFFDAAFDPSNDQRIKTVDGIIGIANDVGLDAAAARKALDETSAEARSVVADFDLALRLNIRGTPTFVVLAKGLPPKVVTAARLGEVLQSPPYRSVMQGG